MPGHDDECCVNVKSSALLHHQSTMKPRLCVSVHTAYWFFPVLTDLYRLIPERGFLIKASAELHTQLMCVSSFSLLVLSSSYRSLQALIPERGSLIKVSAELHTQLMCVSSFSLLVLSSSYRFLQALIPERGSLIKVSAVLYTQQKLCGGQVVGTAWFAFMFYEYDKVISFMC